MTTTPKKPKKKRDPAAPPPRRRHVVPPTGRPGARAELPPLGFPLELALHGPASEVRKSTAEIGTVADTMTLPRAEDGSLQPVPDQTALSIAVAQGLAAEEVVVQRSGLTPGAVLLGERKSEVIDRGKRIAAVGQNLCADGRLFLGGRFSFYFKRLMAVYQRRLAGTPEEQLRALSAFGRIDSIRFRLLKQMLDARALTEEEKQRLLVTLEQQQDEAAFTQALKAIDQGITPDPQTMQRATRHADRVQELFGLGLDETASADRRQKPR